MEGGPVSPERGFVVHSTDTTFESSMHLTDNLALSTALDVLEAIANNKGPEQYMVALGYAGWGEGQLEAEIANNVWLTAPTQPQDTAELLFQTPYEQRLNAAARNIGVDFSLIAARPGHA